MKSFVTLLFALFFLNQTAGAQKFTFLNVNASIADNTNEATHFAIGLGKVIYENSSSTHSIGVRAMYFKHPYSMDGGSRVGIGAAFQVSDLITNSFHLSYQLKRKLFKRFSIFTGFELGILNNTEEFEYWAIDDVTREVVFTNSWKDNYNLNLSYSLDLGLEYIIIKNESYYFSGSASFQILNSFGDLNHNSREGEFIRHEFDTVVEESEFLSEFSANYFWQLGINFGVNI